MVFGLQPLSTSIGSAGGQMGLGGVVPSLGVYIDTYQNTAHGDPFNDHISINLDGDVIHSSTNNIAGPYDLGEVENCLSEPLRITWDPSTTIMNVYYNNTLVLGYTGDIINTVFGGDPMVYWGFTASTGGASNFHQFCLDVPDISIDTTSVIIQDDVCSQNNGSISGIAISGGISPYTWTWNGQNSINTDTSNLGSGTYQLDVIDGMGCNTNHVFTVNDIPAPTIDTSSLILKNEDCNQANGLIQNINIQSTASSLEYYWNGILSDSLNLYNLSADTFQLIVIDNNNCSDTITLNIIDTNYHAISIDYSTAVLEADEPIDFFETSTDSSINWFWTFGDDSTSNLSTPTHSYSYAGDYTICLTASNVYNCTDTTCIDIVLIPAEIIIPNIFTPNDDGINDEFTIQGINDRFKIQIFNRWGNIIFEEDPYLNSWKGIDFKGKKMKNGVYYYVLKNTIDQVDRNGSLRLVE